MRCKFCGGVTRDKGQLNLDCRFCGNKLIRDGQTVNSEIIEDIEAPEAYDSTPYDMIL